MGPENDVAEARIRMDELDKPPRYA